VASAGKNRTVTHSNSRAAVCHAATARRAVLSFGICDGL